ncbi:MAG: glycosyltransferase [Spirochaetaceae bacterium]|jgi:galactofuranosylgalactofuranosylrhamnosyl-N-acetylglucosaminyl-diphospho-decaprenol beta-1,5/1,6-galactofuranosyltransferase|nr:glycosyltransferase [Spirochaetaceae bacterium]
MIENSIDHPLQNLVFQKPETAPEGLYYKGRKFKADSQGLILQPGGKVDFGCYFNIFSWHKWRLYTGLSTLFLRIEGQGTFDLTFRSCNLQGELQRERIRSINDSGLHEIAVPVKLLNGQISLEIKSTQGCFIEEAYWYTTQSPYQRKINLALAFCTFNRDDYLFPNLKLLSQQLDNSVDIMVVDNASQIEEEKIKAFGDNFRLFHNPNLGGSGGFTRAMVEALESDKNYSHILLMDDDVKIEPESIKRTIHLMELLKPEYYKAFLAGGMLQLDKAEMLFELTANWNGFRVKNNKRDVDLTDHAQLCSADEDSKNKNQYAAWWYCCIPLDKEMKNDLPFPFFVYGDDMDYSLRRASGILTMNGIGIWHEPFTKKFSPMMKSYFFCRNTLIVNALHRRFGYFKTAFNAATHFYVQLFVHDYRSAGLALEAVEDFLKGPEFICSLDEEKLLKDKYRPTLFEPRKKEDLDSCYIIQDNFKRFRSVIYFFHKHLAVRKYQEDLYEFRQRDMGSFFRLWFRRFSLSLRFFFRYGSVVKAYRRMQLNKDFWMRRFN